MSAAIARNSVTRLENAGSPERQPEEPKRVVLVAGKGPAAAAALGGLLLVAPPVLAQWVGYELTARRGDDGGDLPIAAKLRGAVDDCGARAQGLTDSASSSGSSSCITSLRLAATRVVAWEAVALGTTVPGRAARGPRSMGG